MNQLKKDLKAVARDLTRLTQKTEKMIRQIERLEKVEPAQKPKVKTVKKAVAKKPAKLSATETVLAIIKRSRKGVDTATLRNKTGLGSNHLGTILYRLRKQSTIKSAGRGLYVKA